MYWQVTLTKKSWISQDFESQNLRVCICVCVSGCELQELSSGRLSHAQPAVGDLAKYNSSNHFATDDG